MVLISRSLNVHGVMQLTYESEKPGYQKKYPFRFIYQSAGDFS